MTHVGGYPGHYDKRIVECIGMVRPNIFVAGHSHILRVMYDRKFDMLYLNPGAAGIYGFHKVRSALRFEIDGSEVRSMELGEWPKRSFND
jgi:predicted phosphodiesterase